MHSHPTEHPVQPADRRFLNGGGEMGERIRAFDWTKTPLGPPEHWPVGLKTAVRIMLTSRQAMWIGWGPELIYLYNDPYKAIIGGKHPSALGQPTSVVWREIWSDIEPLLATARQGDQGTYVEAQLLIMERNGYPEETYYTFSYSPIPDDDGNAGGIICANTDDTVRVVRERQLALLRHLAASAADARTGLEACQVAGGALATDLHDIPFALIYLVDTAANELVLAGASGIEAGHPAAPARLSVDSNSPWPIRSVLGAHAAHVVDLTGPLSALPGGVWDRPPQRAIVVPLSVRGADVDTGVLVVGLNPYRLLDDAYRGFIDLVAGQISSSMANATAYEDERRRADLLVELDRAKTVFFSNVSHEFRTPLTLMLGPLEDLMAQAEGGAPEASRDLLAMVHRNGLRLLKLVNNLLDFSRLEAGRVQAHYEPTDLAALTADIASVFRAAVERAGIRLTIDCPPLSSAVFVEREMWEKVVLNLLSNALKFTFAGEISVRLRDHGEHVTLAVADTGVGIPANELPHIFERFHRVLGARSRTHEGTGIGLALVQELVRLHGGSIKADSEVGRGTTFTVAIPTGSAHLPKESVGATATLPSTSVPAEAYVNEALGGAGSHADRAPAPTASRPAAATSIHILVVDDNADMRSYVSRLLSERWRVTTAADGLEALNAIAAQPPDLVVADVMMPGLDGFGLLNAVRRNPSTRHIPVMLLSARAGEEATLEGITAGADDYLVKPFTARDLMTRVEAQLLRVQERAALRGRTAQIESLLNNAPLGVYLVDQDLRIAHVNPVARPVFGDIPDLVGRDLDEVLHILWAPAFADEIGRLFRHTLQTGEPYVTHERAELRMDRGVVEYYEWRIDRVTLPDGRFGVVCYFRDISAQVQAREAIAHSESQFRDLAESLGEANRLKDEFLATLSHELRTPLNAILGWSHMLRSGALPPHTHSRALTALERNAKAQAQLVEDLLDVSRIVSGKLAIKADAVDLPAVIAGAIDAIRPGATAKQVDVRVAVDRGDRIHVTGDPDRLQQIVWNLLSNAVKFTPSRGRVDVAVRRADGWAEIVVADTGQGIDAGFLPYVFERFRQADSTPARTHGGLGIGLAIVRHLTEAHGGTVTVSSPGPNRGATFVVRLPLRAAGRATAPPGLRTKSAAGALAGVRALIVDDEADARELMRFVLETHGAQVTATESADAAMRLLKRRAFDVIVADIGMPEKDGFSLIKAVRRLPGSSGATPAVAVTAYASARDRKDALDAGFDWHLPKPIEPEQLAAAVATIVIPRQESKPKRKTKLKKRQARRAATVKARTRTRSR